MKTILNTQKGICYVCRNQGHTHEHHIFFGTANRNLSEKYGLKVYLCYKHHQGTPEGVHGGNQALNQKLKEDGQIAFEQKHGSRADFIRIFGRNYL